MKGSQKILIWVVRIFVLLVIAFVLLPNITGSGASVAIIRTLPLGWLNFLLRTLPEVTINWAGIGMVLLCSALILVCLHFLLRALTQKRFRLRWTLAIFASVWLLFCLIIAVAGLSRTIPLLEAQEWYQRRAGYGDLRRASEHASAALVGSEGDSRSLRRLLMDPAATRYGAPLWEEFEFLVCSPAQAKSPCIVVIPRQAKARESFGFSIVRDAGEEEFIPIARLPEKLTTLNAPAAP